MGKAAGYFLKLREEKLSIILVRWKVDTLDYFTSFVTQFLYIDG